MRRLKPIVVPPPTNGHSFADQAIADFVGPKAGTPRKRRGPPTAERAAKLFDEAGRRAITGNPLETPVDLVALYGWLHREVYGVAPAELHGKQWLAAVAAARRMVEQQFQGHVEDAEEFMRWLWKREQPREAWRRKSGKGGSRIGWVLQFTHGGPLTDWRVAQARGVG